MNKCDKCGWTDVKPDQPCPNCARFEQFHKTAVAQGKVRTASHRKQLARQAPSGAGWWFKQMQRDLPLAGQDAALPVGDR